MSAIFVDRGKREVAKLGREYMLQININSGIHSRPGESNYSNRERNVEES